MVRPPCSGRTGLWFSFEHEAQQAAAAECRSCTLRRPCLAGAVERREEHGVWGGISFDVRGRRRRAALFARARATLESLAPFGGTPAP